MGKLDLIIHSALYKESYRKIEAHEANRMFCKHDFVHFLDVARLAQISNLEQHLELSKEMIYATALLHDIGRFEQYENGTSHEVASAPIAQKILMECGFPAGEIEEIVRAILLHRNHEEAAKYSLAAVIYDADKKSRPCFFCKEEKECYWKNDKKNMKLEG